MTTKLLPLESIRIDGNTQPRASISQDTVGEYAALLREKVEMPPLDVFFDGVEHWLADGFHRYHAARSVDWINNVAVTIHKGTRRDAVLFSVGANQAHGLRRTNADKRKAVLTLLADAEWAKWSDREIARRCGVDNHTVADIRASLGKVHSEPTRTVPTKHGTTTQMNVTNIGRARVNGNGRRIYGTEAAAAEKAEQRRGAAIEGVRDSALKSLPRKDDEVAIERVLTALEGILHGLQFIHLDKLSENKQAGDWLRRGLKLCASIRSELNKLDQGGN